MIRPDLIPYSNDDLIYYSSNVDIPEILEAIKFSCYLSRDQLKDFCRSLDSGDSYEDVFYFLKDSIRYKPDYSYYTGKKDNLEVVKLPSKLFSDGVGDCKSFTAFMAGVALNFENPVWLRLVYYTPELYKVGAAHIYPFIKVGGKKIYLDAVNGKYKHEESFYKNEDVKL